MKNVIITRKIQLLFGAIRFWMIQVDFYRIFWIVSLNNRFQLLLSSVIIRLILPFPFFFVGNAFILFIIIYHKVFNKHSIYFLKIIKILTEYGLACVHRMGTNTEKIIYENDILYDNKVYGFNLWFFIS
jgi:hypothetical protein